MSVTEQLRNNVVLTAESWTANEVALIELYSQQKSFDGTNERALANLLIRDGGVHYDTHWGTNQSKASKENDK
jgi:hypothetical protein